MLKTYPGLGALEQKGACYARVTQLEKIQQGESNNNVAENQVCPQAPVSVLVQLMACTLLQCCSVHSISVVAPSGGKRRDTFDAQIGHAHAMSISVQAPPPDDEMGGEKF